MQPFNLIQFAEIPLVKQLGFTSTEMAVFEKHISLQRFKKKTFVLQPGENENYFRFVQKGLVREFYLFKDREINTQFAAQDDIVCSYVSYMSDTPAEYYIEAVEETMLFCFEKEEMDSIMTKGIKFMAFGKRISALISLQKSLREKELLNYDALGRLQHFMDTKPELFLRLPQIYIASYLNIQPETFSVLKKKLK